MISMPGPLVSVIVPACNAMPWLEETLGSISAQTVTDFEVIVVDDGSTDTTAPFVHDYGRRDARVRCVSVANGGVARARDHGVAAATGKYLTFLDSDDLWAPTKLEQQLRLVEGRPRVAAMTGLRRFHDEGGRRQWLFDTIPPGGGPGGAYVLSLLFLRSTEMVGISTCLAPADEWRKLGGYDPTLASAEDWDIWLRAARRFELRTVPGEPLHYYRKRQGSLTTQSSVDHDFGAWCTILRKQPTLGGVSRRDVRRAIAAKRLECADIHRAQGRARASLGNLVCGLADPAILWQRRFHETWWRLLRGR